MRRCAAFVGVISLAAATALLSAHADDNPPGLLQRLSQLAPGAQARPPAAPILTTDDAVVTGFSGVRTPQQVAPGVDPLDKLFIDLDGASIRIVDLSNPGAPAQSQVLPASKAFTVAARQVGQVFAVVLDNMTPPNIYVAATSAYGLPIVAAQPDPDGTLRRLRRGEAGARFMAGLFGPESAGGGPGSIWKIDGRTGVVRLFATVPNSGAGLGDIAFDSARRQFFASDRASGLIHRIGLDGVLRDSYDHGTTGRGAVGLALLPDQPERRVNIQSPAFEPGNPQTWNLPPRARRTFGLAVFRDRLFYALAEGPQVWSVALTPDGGFGTRASWELTVPATPSPAEIASILFDEAGQIYLAERGAPTGAYDFRALVAPGEARVLRYALRQAGDPSGPGRWAPVPDEYAVGLRPDHRNSNGGLALGYAYTAANTFGGCGGTLWATGEHLRAEREPMLARELAASGPLALHGLQGVALDLPRPGNVPPWASIFVRYDDRITLAAASAQSGHVGDVAIWQSCGAPPPRLALTCPAGFSWNGFARRCEVALAAAVTCPAGQRFDGRACIGVVCRGGQQFDGIQCVCPPGQNWDGGSCRVGTGPDPTPPPGQPPPGGTPPPGSDQPPPGKDQPPGTPPPGSDQPPPSDGPHQCPDGRPPRNGLCIVVDPAPEPPECRSGQSVAEGCLCRTGRVFNGICLPALNENGRLPPPRVGIIPLPTFCQGAIGIGGTSMTLRPVGETCCAGNYTCTSTGGACPTGTEFQFLTSTPSNARVCCRSDPTGTCNVPRPPDSPAPQCYSVSREDICAKLYWPVDPRRALCIIGKLNEELCSTAADCAPGLCCQIDGSCGLTVQATSVPTTPQTSGPCPPTMIRMGQACVCPEGQTLQGDRCVPPAQPTSVRKSPKCKSGTRWDGKRCQPIAQPQSKPKNEPQASPGFSIGIGIGVGGGGNRGPRAPGGRTPPPRSGGGVAN